MNLREQILQVYLDAHRGLIEIDQVDGDNVVLSLPLHFSANTRVELTVTRITDSLFAISDMAQTVGELKDAGYGITGHMKQKILGLAELARLEFFGNHLVRKCSFEQLGEAIQEFSEAAKTIGDAYLTYRAKRPKSEEDELVAKVREVFSEKKYNYAERQEINGAIERHKVDFYIAPNGSRGLALAVLPNPSQLVAEAWGFKTQDIKHAHSNLAVSVVYDSSRAKEVSKVILDRMADVPIPSNSIGNLAEMLGVAGIGTGHVGG